MFEEEYAKLSSQDQEAFRLIVNELLSHMYLVETQYDFQENMKKTNHDYLFAERHLALLQEYLGFAGFLLEMDSNYGVIFLRSELEVNRTHFDPLTTKMIYTLRLIYDEKRAELSLCREVFVTVADLVNKMMTLNAIQKKPAQMLLSDSLRKINQFHLIQKQSGKWYAPDTSLLILPSILFVVTTEQITSIQKMVSDEKRTGGY